MNKIKTVPKSSRAIRVGSVLITLLAGMTFIAHAEQRGLLPSDMPESYRTECGSCHVMLPPDLLQIGPWGRIMNQLESHYGVDARIEPNAREEIESFLFRHAGRAPSLVAKRSGDPLRLTETLYFYRRHGKVKPLFQDPQVSSKVNCTACHVQADQGHYYGELTTLSREFLQKNNPVR